ncbi:iron complex transport system substrate-binding protein [Scopulibacillus darangshiensis]|uniref:Iron complex transport system substrate-binding protein n=1 Tax=Scopulibacillus darangshiensis TaxID=442528 RepID=A0A4R2NMF3_9BACL|nr:iron-hydroxamate ABC transporter substrate-binding protein [Scopulibacillus darangshiensis]TCP22682.1 iron complex transport system substrate-binding protein [Scopulibacillus darangshiensis]
MKKQLIPFLLLLGLILSACSSQTIDKEGAKDQSKSSDTRIYQSENGPVKVPAHPKRVVVLSTFAGNVMKLGVNLVGVDPWAKKNPLFKNKLKGVQVVSDDSLEKIIELHPDLIIGLSNTKNIDKLKQIAPTVTYTYGKLDYLEQHIEIGKLLNKEKAAKKWVADFKKREQAAGKKIKKKIGADATVSVIESSGKQLYVFGNNWGRGTEILYQAMGLKMPRKVKEHALKQGYYALSPEVLPEFAGDYVIFSKDSGVKNTFQKTETYKNIPAVKNNRVFEVNAKKFYFNDPLTLEYQLKFFKKAFLGS